MKVCVAITCCTNKLRETKNYISSLNVPLLQDFYIMGFSQIFMQ